jgi:hypothetical protein
MKSVKSVIPVKFFILCATVLSLSAVPPVQANWEGFPSGPMVEHDGKLFFTGGSYKGDGPFAYHNVVTWDGSSFAPYGTQVFNTIEAIAIHSDTVFVGTKISGSSTPLFRVDSALTSEEGDASGGIGVVSARGDISCLVSYGGKLIIGGAFSWSNQPAISTNNIVSWDGTTLESLGSGLNSRLTDLEVYQSNLYCTGFFTTAGGQSAMRIAKWDGANWSALGSGLDGFPYAMAVYNNELYVCGDFNNAGGTPARNVARWNGSSWSAAGTGVADFGWRMTTCGSELYVGGTFKEAGGAGANFLAAWDGANWNNAGGGVDSTVNHLACYNGDLIVSAIRPTEGGFESEEYIEVWSGSSWSEPFNFTGQGPGCCTIAGDANESGGINIGDVTYIIQYMFTGGPPPFCCESADADGSGTLNIGDVTYLIAQMFLGGPEPICGPPGMFCSPQ